MPAADYLYAVEYCGGHDRLYTPGSSRELNREALCGRENYAWTGYRRLNVSHFINGLGKVVTLKGRQGQTVEGNIFKSAATADLRDLTTGSIQLTNHRADEWLALCLCLSYRSRVVVAFVASVVGFMALVGIIISQIVRRTTDCCLNAD